MKTFKDASGRDWEIAVNVGGAKAVRELLSVDLFRLHSTEAERVFSDPCLLVDVLYVLCKDQCQIRKLDAEDFGRQMLGDAIEDGANALLGAVADFFPSQRRGLLAKQMAKAEELTAEMMAAASQALDKLDVKSLLAPIPSKPLTDSAASSD